MTITVYHLAVLRNGKRQVRIIVIIILLLYMHEYGPWTINVIVHKNGQKLHVQFYKSNCQWAMFSTQSYAHSKLNLIIWSIPSHTGTPPLSLVKT